MSSDRGRTDRGLRGDISEVIVFQREITDAQEVIINNYLGAKWGINLISGDYYAGDTGGNGDYDNEVMGLVKLASSEVLSTSDFGGLKISNSETGGAIADEGDAFFIGHNGRSGLSRVWYGDFYGCKRRISGRNDRL